MNRPAVHTLEARLAEAWSPDDWRDVTVLAAVSGGADSVAMLRAMHATKGGGAGRICVAHFNHRLRGDASDDDARFVQELAASLDLACEPGEAEPGALDAGGDGIEAAAREVRYEFLRTTAERLGARYVVTAHTADDQAETILHRIVRGTGVRGLAGMARARPLGDVSLIRPMLAIRRNEVVEYLDALNQPFREDASNADLKFTRNRIRAELLPLLTERFNPAVVDALLRLGALAEETQRSIDYVIDDLYRQTVRRTNDGVAVELHVWMDRHLLRELLKRVWTEEGWPLQGMGFDQWERLASMLDGPGWKEAFPGAVVAEVVDYEIRLSR